MFYLVAFGCFSLSKNQKIPPMNESNFPTTAALVLIPETMTGGTVAIGQ